MSEREPSHLSGNLIARKGRAWPGEIAADAVMREAAAARPRRRMAAAYGLGALVLAAGAGVLGYRLGIEQASRQRPPVPSLARAPAPADRTVAAPPLEVATRVRPPPPATLVPATPAPVATDAPLQVDEPVAADSPAKPGGTFAAAPPPMDVPGEAAAWVDVAAVLDSMAAAAPDAPAAPNAPRPAPTAPAPLPREKPAAATGFRIQLSALRSEAAARREWRRLKRSHGALLGGRQPIVVRIHPPGAKRPVYRLQLASFASRAEARAFCQRARSRKLGCIIVVR